MPTPTEMVRSMTQRFRLELIDVSAGQDKASVSTQGSPNLAFPKLMICITGEIPVRWTTYWCRRYASKAGDGGQRFDRRRHRTGKPGTGRLLHSAI